MNTDLQAAIERGRVLRAKAIVEYEEEERQREYRHRQKITGMWMPYIAAIKTKVPEWATINAPMDSEPSFRSATYDDTQYRPMTVNVGGYIPPIRAWTACCTREDGTPVVMFGLGRWTLYCPEDTGEWIVTADYSTYAITSYQISQAPRDSFYLALAEAADEATRYQELVDEAARRNETAKYKEEMAKIEKETGTLPMPPDPIERIADTLEKILTLIESQATF